jgi:NADPH:quinone reductase-like Zn-dependent oxidoreductase
MIGVGSVASQIARVVLKLPVVVTTASRPETVEFSKSMGATHTVNHREDIVPQIKGLKLDVPLKYIFITHSTDVYLAPCAAVCAPFGTICSIVQTQRMDKMYGTEFMAKSLTFVWELLGTKPYYGVDVDSHGKILRELAQLLDDGQVKCHLKQRLKMNEAGIREGHEIIQGGSSMGKVGLDVDQGDDKSGKAAFC